MPTQEGHSFCRADPLVPALRLASFSTIAPSLAQPFLAPSVTLSFFVAPNIA